MTPAGEGGVRKSTASSPALREMQKTPLPAEGNVPAGSCMLGLQEKHWAG